MEIMRARETGRGRHRKAGRNVQGPNLLHGGDQRAEEQAPPQLHRTALREDQRGGLPQAQRKGTDLHARQTENAGLPQRHEAVPAMPRPHRAAQRNQVILFSPPLSYST